MVLKGGGGGGGEGGISGIESEDYSYSMILYRDRGILFVGACGFLCG